MTTMQVQFTFDDKKMESRNISKTKVYELLKRNFEKKGLPCISDGEVLTFADTGAGGDYGSIWSILVSLIQSDWFEHCASSCLFIENDEEEDVLVQIPKLKKMYQKMVVSA